MSSLQLKLLSASNLTPPGVSAGKYSLEVVVQYGIWYSIYLTSSWSLSLSQAHDFQGSASFATFELTELL